MVDTAETLHDVALLNAAQGNSKQAQTFSAAALCIYERILGGTHPYTIKARHDYTTFLETCHIPKVLREEDVMYG